MPDGPSAAVTVAGRPSGALRALGAGLLACGRGIPVLLTTATAFFSSLTALGVYQGEQNRQSFERMRHSYEVYRDYGHYLDSHPPALPCMQALTPLSAPDLVHVMRFVETASFRFDPSTHASLVECLDGERRKQVAGGADWTVDDTRHVRSKMLSQIGALDTALLSYYNDIGDKGIICANFRGLFEVATIRDFYAAVIRAAVVNDGNYPNVRSFATYVASGRECPSAGAIDARKIEILDRYKSLLLRAAGEGSG